MPLDKEKKREEFKRLRKMLQERESGAMDGSAARASLSRRSSALTHDDLRRIVARRNAPTPPTAPAPRSPAGSAPIVYSRSVPRGARQRPSHDEPTGPRVSLADAVPGTELAVADAAVCYLVNQAVDEEDKGAELNYRFGVQLDDPQSELRRRVEDKLELDRLAREDFVFMDIETTGLSSTPVFLIGVMVWEQNGFVVKQYLARHYGEERGVLTAFRDLCHDRRILVTFNGKSFDFPFIRTRCAATGTSFNVDMPHLDLLHVSRRIWKGRFPDCKLQTLEWHVCRRMRYGDIPGSEIPDAYHAFVRSGNADRLAAIMEHNKLDLITLADLMTRFPDQPGAASEGVP